MTSSADVESFRLSALANYGIVVNPQWTVASLQPEDLYLITVEGVTKILLGASAEPELVKLNPAAVTSWIKEHHQDSADILYKQAVSDAKALPKKLPGGAKERFDACSTLAQLLKSVVGVPDHIDYSCMMYPNEKHSRDLISALVERLGDHNDRLREEADAAKKAASASSSAARHVDAVPIAFAALSNRRAGVSSFKRPAPRRFIRMSTKPIASIKKPDQVVSTALYANALRRVMDSSNSRVGGKFFGGLQHDDDPTWVQQALGGGNIRKGRRWNKKGEEDEDDDEATNNLIYGSVADIAPERAAAQEREAAEVQARLKSAEASVAQMKMSVEDAQRARELEDEQLSEKLRELRSGIKLFKSRVKSARSEMEALEQQFTDLEASETENDAAHDEALAELTARKELLDGVESGGDDFVATLDGKLGELKDEHAELLRSVESKMAKQNKKRAALVQKLASLGPSKKDRLVVLQQQCKNLARDCRQRLEEFNQLEAEYERSTAKSKLKVDRDVLSKMIYEITVQRHAKQEEQIQSIVHDIGIAGRRIADQTGAIAKRYEKMESEMYATAKTDAGVRDLFAPLVNLRTEYVNLVKRIEERGKARKETHDVESRLNKLMRFSDSSMLASAERDLQLVTESVKQAQANVDSLTKASATDL